MRHCNSISANALHRLRWREKRSWKSITLMFGQNPSAPGLFVDFIIEILWAEKNCLSWCQIDMECFVRLSTVRGQDSSTHLCLVSECEVRNCVDICQSGKVCPDKQHRTKERQLLWTLFFWHFCLWGIISRNSGVNSLSGWKCWHSVDSLVCIWVVILNTVCLTYSVRLHTADTALKLCTYTHAHSPNVWRGSGPSWFLMCWWFSARH